MTDHIYWKNGVLYLLDQRELPFRKTYVKCRTAGDVMTAISNMTVRGAPLLGIVAAYGMVLGVKEVMAARRSVRRVDIARIAKKLGATRPTAVNLFWALRE
jgi:methylthioribose-1-phosphate isomerase